MVVLVQEEERYVDYVLGVLKWIHKGWIFSESLLQVSVFSRTKEDILGLILCYIILLYVTQMY